MCGIAGWINYNENISEQTSIIDAMTDSLSHRGPDDRGIWKGTNALIGHRRLSVIDPSGGAQPMVRKHNNINYIITYNGELYNALELKSILSDRGYAFKTNCDTEVLLVSYIEWGKECVDYLNGIYAFGIWNDVERSLFLARDRFGVKPLFYTTINHNLMFGSEIKALLSHPKIEARIDLKGLSEIFALGPSRTPGEGIFSDIHELKPAYCLLMTEKSIKIKKYWSLESHLHTDCLSKTVQTLRDLVTDAIKRQLISDVPLCSFLSGGLDSSAISAISSIGFRDTNKGVLNTYSVDYTDNDKYFKPGYFQPDADSPWIKKVSQNCGTDHHYIFINTPELIESLKDAVFARDLPGMADIDSSLMLFCRRVRENNTVALSGECADEIFGGYPWYFEKDVLSHGVFPWMRNTQDRLDILSRDTLETIKPLDYIKQQYNETLDEVPHLKGECIEAAQKRSLTYLNLNWFMQTLLERKDRMSMSCGLEVRVPYCDHRLAQYAWNIPWEMKALGGKEKGLLRKSLEGLLPHDVIYRKKSPYPKTYNPNYEKGVSSLLLNIINDSASPINQFIDSEKLNKMITQKDNLSNPFFGQLMARPQLFAYLYQVDFWLREYKISVK